MKSKELSGNFDLLGALSRPEMYNSLFPDEVEGLVIISLHERIQTGLYPEGLFTEEDIHELFWKFQKPNNDKEGKYYQKTRNKNRIKKLLRFFLNYDEEKRLYYFQEYARAFCELSRKTVEGALVPTQIELICSDLLNDLIHSSHDDQTLSNWFEIKFDAYKTKLAQQTDFLHQQIDDAVNKLRKDILQKEQKPLDLLKTVRDDLSDIQEKNQELRIAFQDTNKIVSQLINIDTEDSSIIQNIRNTISFFSQLQRKLRSTDSRLNRIQPKIKQLFGILRESELSASTDRLIHFLLNHSQISGNSKEVVFPSEISSIQIVSHKSKLIVFKRDQTLFPSPAKPRKHYPVDENFQNESKIQMQLEIDSFKRIEGWINQFMAQLDKDDHLDASQSFFEVLATDDNFFIASNVLFGVIDRVHKSKKYKVNIRRNEPVRKPETPIELWKITILQR